MKRLKSNLLKMFIVLMFYGQTPGVSAKVVDQIVAKINGEIITLSEVRRNYLQYREFSREENEIARTESDFLEMMIEQKLKLQYARKKGIEPSKQDIYEALDNFKKKNLLSEEMFSTLLSRENQSLDDYKKRIGEQIILSRLNNYEVESKIVVGLDEVEKYFYAHQEEFLMEEEIKLGHIFFPFPENNEGEITLLKEKGLKVLERIKKGEDFSSLAKENSAGPTAAKGGVMGYFKPGYLSPEFDAVAFHLQKGEVSELIETKTGFHILYVFEKKNKMVNALDKVRKEIERKLFSEKTKKKYDDWMKELREQSYIEILMANNGKIPD